MIGCSPSVGNSVAEACRPITCSGSPRPVSVNALPADNARSLNTCCRCCTSRNRGIREPDAGEVVGLVGGREPHQSIGLVIRQRPQEHGVDDAEERDIGANAEREAENGDEREPRRLEQLTEGVAERGSHGASPVEDVNGPIVHRVTPPFDGCRGALIYR